MRSITDHANNFTVIGNLELGQGLDEMESFFMTVTDWSTNETEVDETAQVACDINPSRVNSCDIASCILTDIVYF